MLLAILLLVFGLTLRPVDIDPSSAAVALDSGGWADSKEGGNPPPDPGGKP